MRARSWGYWTRGKLDLLAKYLDGFTVASKGQREIVYLDAFAGQLDNVDRVTGDAILGSAEIALRTHNASFTRVHLFEIGQRAGGLETELRKRYPGRDVHVHEGNCNQRIPEVLDELRPIRWAPTFAFLDPDGMEVRWSTIAALAAHKANEKYKVELWMLFSSAGVSRTLPLGGKPVLPEDEARTTALFGSDDWRPIYDARLAGTLSGGEAREEYVNLMRWRLEHDLRYRWTHALEVKNEQRRPLYHMIFATDNEAGNRIMTHLYDAAADTFTGMLDEAKRARAATTGILTLDIDVPSSKTRGVYQYESPSLPYGMVL